MNLTKQKQSDINCRLNWRARARQAIYTPLAMGGYSAIIEYGDWALLKDTRLERLHLRWEDKPPEFNYGE